MGCVGLFWAVCVRAYVREGECVRAGMHCVCLLAHDSSDVARGVFLRAEGGEGGERDSLLGLCSCSFFVFLFLVC